MGGTDPPYTIPHYSTFKVEGCKPIEELQQALAKKELCDPWLRNEVWRFHPGFGTKWARARSLFFRGAIPGAILAAITVAITKMLPEDCETAHGGHHH